MIKYFEEEEKKLDIQYPERERDGVPEGWAYALFSIILSVIVAIITGITATMLNYSLNKNKELSDKRLFMNISDTVLTSFISGLIVCALLALFLISLTSLNIIMGAGSGDIAADMGNMIGFYGMAAIPFLAISIIFASIAVISGISCHGLINIIKKFKRSSQ
jgi:H+/Cl- antiporter ClcA